MRLVILFSVAFLFDVLEHSLQPALPSPHVYTTPQTRCMVKYTLVFCMYLGIAFFVLMCRGYWYNGAYLLRIALSFSFFEVASLAWASHRVELVNVGGLSKAKVLVSMS